MARRISSPVFVGREAELGRVLECFSEAAELGSGRIVLVTGEAGVGKSRFCRELSSGAAGRGWTVLAGSCDEFANRATSFTALREMIPALGAFLEIEAPAELSQPGWTALERLASGFDQSRPAEGSVVQLAEGLLRRIARIRPLLVIHDDLHWGDESTLLLFAGLARAFRNVPAVLVGAYRPHEGSHSPALRQVIASIHRNASPEILALQPLEHIEAQSMAANIVEQLDEARFERAFASSRGNPFFLEELLASSMDEVPLAVSDVVLTRVDSAGPNARIVAEAAALDTGISRQALASISALGPNEFATAVDGLCLSGMLVLDGNTYRFRHPLVREALDRQIPPGRRTVFHRRLAEALVEHEPQRYAEIARHWQESGDLSRELAARVDAGRAASNRGAFPEAADHFERALQIWDLVPASEAPAVSHDGLELTDWTGRDALLMHADEAFKQSGRFAANASFLEAALASQGKRTKKQRAMLLWRLSGAYFFPGDPELFPRSLQLLRETASELETTAGQITVSLLAVVAFNISANFGLDEEAHRIFDEACDEARAIANVAASAARIWIRAARGQGLSHEDLQFVEELPRPWAPARWRVLLGLHETNVSIGLQTCEENYEHGYGLVDGVASEAFVSRSMVRLSRWNEALARFTLLCERLSDEPLKRWADVTVESWGPAMVRVGDVESATRWVSLGAPITLGCREPFLLHGLLLTQVELARGSGDRGAARSALLAGLPVAVGHTIAFCGEPVAFAIALEADWAFSHVQVDDEAIALAKDWIARLKSCLVDAPGRARIDDLGVFIEQAEAETNRLAGHDTPGAWRRLLAAWEALGRPYHEAYAHYRLAFSLLMSPDLPRGAARKSAAAHLEAAESVSRDIGAVALAEDCARLRRSGGLREVRRPRRSAAPAHAASEQGPALSPRETEVLRLLVAGQSNGQIAVALGISVKTASVHVSNILRKLGAANRVEAAVRASRTSQP